MVQKVQRIEIVRPKGSVCWLIFWIIMLWPVAIVYYFMRDWEGSKDSKKSKGPKKPWYKRWWGIVIIIYVLFVTLSIIASYLA